MPQKQDIAVVGGGMTGIAAALELAKADCAVTLFEKRLQLGGLSDYYTWKNITWDRFYHVVLSTDTVLRGFLSDIGLQDRLFWQNTRSGFYGDGRLVSMSTTLDFVRFPFLSLWQKFRLGLGILYSARLEDATKLDRIYARQWLTKIFGRRVYEKMWDPLLRSKLGSARDKTSAAFMWATIKRLYGARSADNKQEQMGHVHGGYQTILTAAENRLKSMGVTILTDTPVTRIQAAPTGSILSTQSTQQTQLTQATNPTIKLTTPDGQNEFHKVLLTVDCPTVLSTITQRNGHPYWSRLADVEYLGVICVMLILNRSLSPYYVINLLDRSLPFTGIIESTNVVDPKDLDNHHIVFLPKYVTADDPASGMDDKDILDLFIRCLMRVFPDLVHSNIRHARVFRETYVQPLQTLHRLDQSIDMTTPIENVYLANTSMIINSTLNNNAAITLGKKAAQTILRG